MFYLSKRLQTFVQLDAAKVRAPGEGATTDCPHAGGQVYPFDTALRERGDVYLLETLRELHVPQILAAVERPRLDGLQRRRDSDALQPTF